MPNTKPTSAKPPKKPAPKAPAPAKKAPPPAKGKSASGAVYNTAGLVRMSNGATALPFKRVGKDARTEEAATVYVDPLESSGTELPVVEDKGQVVTMTRSSCSDTENFTSNVMKVFSLVFNLPVFFQESATAIVQDKRGTLVELYSTGVSFRNVSMNDVTIHCNTPVSIAGDSFVFARLPGFFKKTGNGKKRFADSVSLKPNQSAIYSVNWKDLPSSYTPIKTSSSGNFGITAATFSVHIHNAILSEASATTINELSETVQVQPMAKYLLREQDAVANSEVGQVVKIVEVPHFSMAQLPSNEKSLWGIDPLTPAAAAYLTDPRKFITDASTVTSNTFISDLSVEGTFFGAMEENVSGYTYPVITLAVKNGISGSDKPASLISRQSILTRIGVVGLNFSTFGEDRNQGGPAQNATSMSVFKWDTRVNRWLLWNDLYDKPYRANYTGSAITLPTSIPVYYFTLPSLAIKLEETDVGKGSGPKTERVVYFNRSTDEEISEFQFNTLRDKAQRASDPRGIGFGVAEVDLRGVSIADILGVLITVGKIASTIVAFL